jgi:hypothetical protein
MYGNHSKGKCTTIKRSQLELWIKKIILCENELKIKENGVNLIQICLKNTFIWDKAT